MSGVNKAIIVGRLGKEPETRYLPDGTAVTNFSMATSQEWKDKATGEKKEKTEWHNISCFGRTAEIAGEYLLKGSQCYIEGEIETRKRKDKDGNDRYTTSIKAKQLQLLDPPRTGRNAPGQGPKAEAQHQASIPVPAEPDFSDDIPF